MKLRDLHPKLSGTAEAGTLRFDCPIPEHGHKICVPLGTTYWHATGEFPDGFTVLPSVNATGPTCRWHGNITNGEVSTGPVRKARSVRRFKKHGRRTPYTEIGIARIPCVRCGQKPSVHQFQICADGRKYRPLCVSCDVALNKLVCEFLQLPDHARRLRHYMREAKVE